MLVTLTVYMVYLSFKQATTGTNVNQRPLSSAPVHHSLWSA